MNMPNTMMRNAISRRGAMRSDGAAGAPIIAGGAVVAFAMGGSVHAQETDAPVICYCGWIIIGESRSALLSASSAPFVLSTVT